MILCAIAIEDRKNEQGEEVRNSAFCSTRQIRSPTSLRLLCARMQAPWAEEDHRACAPTSRREEVEKGLHLLAR